MRSARFSQPSHIHFRIAMTTNATATKYAKSTNIRNADAANQLSKGRS